MALTLARSPVVSRFKTLFSLIAYLRSTPELSPKDVAQVKTHFQQFCGRRCRVVYRSGKEVSREAVLTGLEQMPAGNGWALTFDAEPQPPRKKRRQPKVPLRTIVQIELTESQ